MTWKAIPSAPQYEAHEMGVVRRIGKRNLLTMFPDRRGYLTVTVSSGGRQSRRFVHSLVAESHIGPRPKGLTVNHRDGNKTNNAAPNLEYITLSENIRHAFRLGLYTNRMCREGRV